MTSAAIIPRSERPIPMWCFSIELYFKEWYLANITSIVKWLKLLTTEADRKYATIVGSSEKI